MSVPTNGAILGLDFGTRRIGVAITTPSQEFALPLETYERRTETLDAQWLRSLARGYQAVGLVIGLPVHMSGDEGGKALEARQFGEWARQVTDLPIAFWDERYSSSLADAYLSQTSYTKKTKKSKRDQVAAQVILQSFLGSKDRTAAPVNWREASGESSAPQIS